MATPIGKLTERVIVHALTPSTDTQGGRSETWAALAGQPSHGVAADVRPWPRAGGEHLVAQTVTAIAEYQVEIRYWGDVTAKMRLLWTPYRGTQKTLEIHEVHRLGHDRMLLDSSEVAV